MTSEDKETVPKIEEPKGEATPVTDPIKQSELELKKRYPGLNPKMKSVAQRKISSGGIQYFDSGDYNAASRKDKQKIADNPNPINPAVARLRHKTTPSKLASHPPPPSGLQAATRAEH